MKLFIRQETTASNTAFTVLDELCDEKYYALISKPMPAMHIDIVNTSYAGLAKITKLPLPMVDAYNITVGRESIRLIINTKSCKFYGISWYIRGDIITKSFDIMDVDSTVLATHIRRYGKSCCYEINIFKEKQELFCLAVALCINLKQASGNLNYVLIR